jgi:hypothetical protein
MLLGYVSDEYYAALADVQVELINAAGDRCVIRSTPSGALSGDLPAGEYELVFYKPGFGAKRSRAKLGERVQHFRLLSDGLLGYAWPKWCRAGDSVAFRVHSVEPYKLGLWRHGLQKEFVRNVGWYDNHGPRAIMQTVPDGFFVETGVGWSAGHGTVHQQQITAPEASGLYYFHARGESGKSCSFPLVVAPRSPSAKLAKLAVLASTNTWNAYNPFGGRSNYILAERMIDEPIVNSQSDLPRYKLKDYGEWQADYYEPISFDRPEPRNQIPWSDDCSDPIEGRMECALAPAEWRTLGWLEREGFGYDLYSDWQLHDGTLPLDQYDVLLLNVHPEYWSLEMYQRVKAWVFEQGGKLLYLGGNGINCRVEFLNGGKEMVCHNRWDAGKESRFHVALESEANLLGVAYSDPGAMTVAPYRVIEPGHWAFAGTGLKRGDLFGTKILHQRYGDGASGHETDKITPSSPKNVQLLACGLNPDEGGAHLVHFATPSEGEVFSVGSITFPTGLLCDELTSTITANVLRRWLA